MNSPISRNVLQLFRLYLKARNLEMVINDVESTLKVAPCNRLVILFLSSGCLMAT